jgi:hypothetical protein
MKYLFIFLVSILAMNGCASKKYSATAEGLRSTISDHKHEIFSCYDEYLKVKPNAHGKMIMEWVVTDVGAAKDFKLTKNPFEDETVYNCCIKNIATWKFPSPPNGQEFVVSYPFLFNVHVGQL